MQAPPRSSPLAPRRGLQRAVAALAVGCAAGLAAALAHAGAARGRWEAAEPARAAAVRLVGLPDLALSSTSRWLRHPSQAEPAAPFHDGIAVPDPDPAGGLLAPPPEAFEGPAVEVR